MDPGAGADGHQRVTHLAVLRDGPPPSQARCATDGASVEGALTRLPVGTTLAVESTGSWWWVVDTTRRVGHQVVRSPPRASPERDRASGRREARAGLSPSSEGLASADPGEGRLRIGPETQSTAAGA